MAVADLQPALEENERKSKDMEKAPEVWDARVAQLRLRVAEYDIKSGAARVVSDGD